VSEPLARGELVRLRGDEETVYVILTEPHRHPDDDSGVLYVSIQPQNASAPPVDAPIADLEPAT
jgi:hypothetical protein